MANSKIISDIKNTIIKEIIGDTEIANVIDAPDVKSSEANKLVGKYIFRYNQNPNTLKHACTFVTVLVDLIQDYYNDMYVIAQVEIGIYTHESKMEMHNDAVRDNRNDYLSILLDQKFNGHFVDGFGEMKLYDSREGSLVTDWLYRRMVFNIKDLNDSLCVGDEDE